MYHLKYEHPLFVQFMVYFNENQDFFECHEVLEELWKSHPFYDKKDPLVALILVATSMYHWRRHNWKGAEKTLYNARKRLHDISWNFPFEERSFKENLQWATQRITNEQPFEPFTLHIVPTIKLAYEQTKRQMTLEHASSPFIHHKHRLRDRTCIIRERQMARKRKERKRHLIVGKTERKRSE